MLPTEYQIGLTLQQYIWNSTRHVCRSVFEKVMNTEKKSSISQKTSITDLLQDSKDTTGLQFKEFSIQLTLDQEGKPS